MNRIGLMLILMIMSAMVTAEEKQPEDMTFIYKWNGPFEGTRIIKYADYDEGVACYVYIPTSINYSNVYSGNTVAKHFGGSIGSISCVKVADNSKKK